MDGFDIFVCHSGHPVSLSRRYQEERQRLASRLIHSVAPLVCQNALTSLSTGVGTATTTATANVQKALTSLAGDGTGTATAQKALTSLARGSLRSPLARNVASLRSATLSRSLSRISSLLTGSLRSPARFETLPTVESRTHSVRSDIAGSATRQARAGRRLRRLLITCRLRRHARFALSVRQGWEFSMACATSERHSNRNLSTRRVPSSVARPASEASPAHPRGGRARDEERSE